MTEEEYYINRKSQDLNREASEEIYITYEGYGVFGDAVTMRTSDSQIEYVRKDAFIEKACEKLKKCMYDNLMFQGRLHRKEVIETFIEDFKKYMED